jgi:hypothetical protein
MREIAPKITKKDSLPLPFDQSQKYVPRINNEEALPLMYKYLKNK